MKIRTLNSEMLLPAAIIVGGISFVFCLIPVIGPAFLTYHFSRLNKTIGGFTNGELITIILIGEAVFSLAVAVLDTSYLKEAAWLFLINAIPAAIFFLLGLYKEKIDEKKGITI